MRRLDEVAFCSSLNASVLIGISAFSLSRGRLDFRLYFKMNGRYLQKLINILKLETFIFFNLKLTSCAHWGETSFFTKSCGFSIITIYRTIGGKEIL